MRSSAYYTTPDHVHRVEHLPGHSTPRCRCGMTTAERIAAVRARAGERLDAAAEAYTTALRGSVSDDAAQRRARLIEAVEYDAAREHAREIARLTDQWRRLTGPQPHLARWSMADLLAALDAAEADAEADERAGLDAAEADERAGLDGLDADEADERASR